MILAIDQSLSETGFCYISRAGKIFAQSARTSSKLQWLDRVQKILSALEPCFLHGDKEGSPIERVVMEGYAFGGSTKGFVLGELGGVLKYFFGIRGLFVYQIVAAHHKMYTTRDGHADKAKTIKGLKDRFGIAEPNDNIADAISMALLARHQMLAESGAAECSSYEKNLFAKVRSSFELQERNPEELERRRIARKAKTAKRRGKGRAAERRGEAAGGCGQSTTGSHPKDPFEVR